MSSLSNIQLQIKDALEKYEKLSRIDRHINGINKKLSEAYKTLENLDNVLDDELKDIEKLESIGITSVFHKVLGNKDEQLDKERQDFLEASLKYKEFKSAVELMEYEKELLQKKLHQLPLMKNEIDRLKALREKELLSNDTALRLRLIEIIDKQDSSIILRKEILDAIEEGEKSEKMLNVVLSYLKKARDWGRWDKKSHKKMELQKHSAIDKAIKNISRAQFQLDLFAQELNDIGRKNLNLKLNHSHFNQFTDFFFDNLISDWIVQQKIKSTISSIESTYDHVHRILLGLRKEYAVCEKHLNELEDQKNKLLLS